MRRLDYAVLEEALGHYLNAVVVKLEDRDQAQALEDLGMLLKGHLDALAAVILAEAGLVTVQDRLEELAPHLAEVWKRAQPPAPPSRWFGGFEPHV